MSRFNAQAEIKTGQGNQFLWYEPAVLFNTANHDGSLSTPMINEGTTGSVWDLVVQTGYSKYWAIKNYNWGTSTDVGTSWPTDWTSFYGGPPSNGVIVNIHITGPTYDGVLFSESEFICNKVTSAGLTSYHSFFPGSSWNWFEVDTYAQNNWPFTNYVNYADGMIEETGGSNIDFGLLMYGTAMDVPNLSMKTWIYDKTYGLASYTHNFTGDGTKTFPVSPTWADYITMYNGLATYGPATTIEATQNTIEKFFAYIGDNSTLPGVGTSWGGCYIAGVWRPSAIPSDTEILALYDYYVGQL